LDDEKVNDGGVFKVGLVEEIVGIVVLG